MQSPAAQGFERARLRPWVRKNCRELQTSHSGPTTVGAACKGRTICPFVPLVRCIILCVPITCKSSRVRVDRWMLVDSANSCPPIPPTRRRGARSRRRPRRCGALQPRRPCLGTKLTVTWLTAIADQLFQRELQSSVGFPG